MRRHLVFYILTLIVQVNSLVLECSFQLMNITISFPTNTIDPQLECVLEGKINMTERNEEVTEVQGNWDFEIPNHLSEYLRTRFGNYEGFKNYEEVTSLRIYKSISMKGFPRKISTFLQHIITFLLEDSELDSIESEDLKQFPNLINFLLQKTKILTLEPDLFQYNPQIEAIAILSANIEYVHKNTFRALTRLKSIQFNSACFRDSISASKAYKQFYIENIIRHCSYDQNIFCFYKTDDQDSYTCTVQKYRNIKTYMNVEVDGMHEMNRNASDVTKIEILTTEPGQGYTVPGFFGEKLPNIKILSTSGNFTELWIDYLGKYKNLEELYMLDNFIRILRSDIFTHNQKLRIIDLSGNQITEIGIGTFFNLKALTYLNLRNNLKIDWKGSNVLEIKNFIPILLKSKAVIHDALYCNYENKLLKYIGRAYQCYAINNIDQTNLKALRDIHFAFGNISPLNITNDAVTALKIEKKYLPKFPPHFYDAFWSLKSITVRKCFVKKLPPTSFSEFTMLKVIDLSHNLLEKIDPRTFLMVRRLIYLNLESNHIKYLSGDSFKSNRFLEHVNLIGNECIDKLIPYQSEVQELAEVLRKNCE